jgi:hypothetical protein
MHVLKAAHENPSPNGSLALDASLLLLAPRPNSTFGDGVQPLITPPLYPGPGIGFLLRIGKITIIHK